MTNMKELWKPAVYQGMSFEGWYEVSNLGRVRSLDRIRYKSNGVTQPFKGKILQLNRLKSGHLRVSLSKDDQESVHTYVHILVATAFCKRKHGCNWVCHKNDVPDDNKSTNLYWGTPSTNAKDAYRNGKVAWNKSSDGLARKIRRMEWLGWERKETARRCGVTTMTVSNCINRRHRFKEA
jgi:hypothetical protein